MNQHEIRSLVKDFGPNGFGQIIEAVLNGHKLQNGAVVRKQPTDFSFKEMWEGCVGPVSETINGTQKWYQEAGALDATGFPAATEKLLAAEMIAGYNSVDPIANILVPRTYQPKSLKEVISGFTTIDTSKPILSGEEYPTVGFGEKYVTFEEAVHQKKEGYEIQVLEDTIRFDQTNMILDQARTLGSTLNNERERRTVRAVLGIGSDTGTTKSGVYFPTGVDTPLYSATQSNLRTNAAPIVGSSSALVDYTDLQEAITVQALNIKDDRQNGTTRPIVWNPRIMLVPISLQVIAGNIFASTGQVYITNTGSTPEIRNNAPSPLATIFRGGSPQLVSSVYVDEVSATQWALYDPESFVRIEVFPFQTFRSPMGYGWNRDLVFAMRAREWSRVIAKDYRKVQLSAGA